MMTTVTATATGAPVVRFESSTEAVAHTLVTGDVPGTLPLIVTKATVGELVEHNRGAGWRVAVREVAVLRVFHTPVAGDRLTTTVVCHEEPGDHVVAGARCMLGDVLVATVTVRLAVRRAV
jgi:hypothetical protein